jgi:glutamine cyclotransferase
MKRTFFPVVLIICLFVTFISCSNKPKRSRKPVSSITIEPVARNYIFGNTVAVDVKTKLRNGEIDNIKLYYEGQLIKESTELDFRVENVTLNSVGRNTFRAVATKTDSVSNTRVISVNVVSDIEPKKYTYKTVNNYPHNQDFYTQGLEFHNGFLYEGTGENGASGLFKVNYTTGEILQQHLLDEKYFGEGITILNDKIYQLTYRAQKGFVYNLGDFAKIDSFQFQSQQGWGLTNDGENLIMSNGTHEIIWLNPEDFSEVKRIQVANNRGIINNINELELINGSLFANVYTTNLIIEIDPETGKVLSEINMEGILNLYQNPEDQIDYLNGIAYNAQTNRLFVTGKWWPRMFEIELVPSE